VYINHWARPLWIGFSEVFVIYLDAGSVSDSFPVILHLIFDTAYKLKTFISFRLARLYGQPHTLSLFN